MSHANDSKFVRKKWNIVNDNSNSNYAAANEISSNTGILKSNLCDYNDAFILVTADIIVIAAPETQVAFRNFAPFTKRITKSDRTTVDDAEKVDLMMQMYNLIEYSWNYSETTGDLSFYSKNKATDFNADIVNDNDFKPFKYNAKLLRNIAAQDDHAAYGIPKNVTIAMPLTYLSNSWRSFEMPLINCKVELKLKWSNYCVLSAAGNDNTNDNDDHIIFTIKHTKLYIPVVTLSARDSSQKLIKLLNKRFERSVYCNEYKTRSENENTTNEYRYFVESNFFGAYRLFVPIYSNEDADSKRYTYQKA